MEIKFGAQISNIRWIIEKARKSQKNIYFCFIDYAKVFDCVDQTNWGKLLRGGNIRPPTYLLRNLYAGQEATLELDMEPWTSSKLGKEYVKAVYCHPAYLTSM